MNVFLKMLDRSASSGSGFGSYTMIIMMVVLVAVMYFFMIRPSRKQEKETNAMRAGLQVGDEITTIGGIIGKIVSIKGETVTIETSKDRTKIRILRTAVKTVDVPAAIANGPVPSADNTEEQTGNQSTSSANDEKPKKKGLFGKLKKK